MQVLRFTTDVQAWETATPSNSLSHKFFTYLMKLRYLVPGQIKVITRCNLPVPVTFFSMSLGLIISPYHVAKMLTLAILMKKVHLQLLEDITLIWPLQTDLTTNPHSISSQSDGFFLYFNTTRISSIAFWKFQITSSI